MIIALGGRLDTGSAPQLEAELQALPKDVAALSFDFKELDYISSAGLRVVLSFQKRMNQQGKMAVFNVRDSIMEVFEVTGFSGVLTIYR